MDLKGQHTGSLLTFFTGLFILAHAAVPHHHHFELTHSSEQESNCESSSQEKNTENPDSHCHAFNVLVSEKTSTSSLNLSLSDYFSFSLTGIIVNIELPPVKKATTPIFGQQAVFLKQFFFASHSLRAPPVNA